LKIILPKKLKIINVQNSNPIKSIQLIVSCFLLGHLNGFLFFDSFYRLIKIRNFALWWNLWFFLIVAWAGGGVTRIIWILNRWTNYMIRIVSLTIVKKVFIFRSDILFEFLFNSTVSIHNKDVLIFFRI
jgi:hypothetical protein